MDVKDLSLHHLRESNNISWEILFYKTVDRRNRSHSTRGHDRPAILFSRSDNHLQVKSFPPSSLIKNPTDPQNHSWYASLSLSTFLSFLSFTLSPLDQDLPADEFLLGIRHLYCYGD